MNVRGSSTSGISLWAAQVKGNTSEVATGLDMSAVVWAGQMWVAQNPGEE